MKSNLKAFLLALAIFCSGSLASASMFHGPAPASASSPAHARIYRIFSHSHAQTSGSFVILSRSQASTFGSHLSLGDRTIRAGQLVLGLGGYRGANRPAHTNGLRAFVDASGATALRNAAASIRSFAASLPESSEPGILFGLGIGLMGSSLLVLRRRSTASA